MELREAHAVETASEREAVDLSDKKKWKAAAAAFSFLMS
jgi:hypothetical protein